MQHRRTKPPCGVTGVDITANINLRMIKPEDREKSADGMSLDGIAEAIAHRLPASVRDEAIWQYHLRGMRGVILWDGDHSFRYLQATELDGGTLLSLPPEKMLYAYEPTKEALVLSEHPAMVELLRVEEDGRVTVLTRNRTSFLEHGLRKRIDS